MSVGELNSDLSSYLSGLDGKLMQAVKLAPETPKEPDKDEAYFCTPAPNAIEWVTSKEFLNSSSTFRHWRQYEVIRDLFQLYCPVCNKMDEGSKAVWGKSQLELEDQVLLVWNASNGEDTCPKCHSTRSELVTDGLLKHYDTLHAVVGMRGGKTATASMIASYIESRVINVGHTHVDGLAGYFDQLPGQQFEVTFVASTDVQSQDTIWSHFMGRRNFSPWIQRYRSWMQGKTEDAANRQLVRPLTYEEHDKIISNDFLGVVYNSLNSNSSSVAGRTRIAAFIDELARFDNSDSKRSADEGYRVLENSLHTVRSAAIRFRLPSFFGLMAAISSPISVGDKCMRLLAQAPRLKKMYAIHYATWDFNPFEPRENFIEDYIKDPLGAERDFGANPPYSASPLIEDPIRFREQVTAKDLKATAFLDYYTHMDKSGHEYRAVRLPHATMVLSGPRFVTFDAGATFDSFAGAAAHGEVRKDPTTGDDVFVTVFDWVMRILPSKMPKRDVWFDSVVQLMETLKKFQLIARVEFDRWNSTMLLQRLRDMNISCDTQGTTVTDFLRFVADANLGRIQMLPPAETDGNIEPNIMTAQGVAYYELERLQRSDDLRKVYNPNKGERLGYNSDDVAQVVVHTHRMVQDSVAPSVSVNPHSAADRLKLEEMGSARFLGGQIYKSRGMYNMRRW